jgi:thioredoxin-like negative regulator of GroEL
MIRSGPHFAALVLLMFGAFVAEHVLTSTPSAAAPQIASQTSGPLPGSALAACLKNGLPTLVDFGETWCAACKQQAPVLDASAQKYLGRANLVYVDCKQYASLADSYRITALPTQIFFDRNGEAASRHVGYYPPEAIAAQLAKLGAADLPLPPETLPIL